jgi:hypothetical protein
VRVRLSPPSYSKYPLSCERETVILLIWRRYITFTVVLVNIEEIDKRGKICYIFPRRNGVILPDYQCFVNRSTGTEETEKD